MEKQQLTEIIRSKASLKMSEQEYRDYPAINYSALSTLSKDPRNVGVDRDQTESMILGSIVDNLLTRGDYGQEYAVNVYQKPTGQMAIFCDILIEETLADNPMKYQIAFDATGSKKYKLEWFMENYKDKDPESYVKSIIAARENKQTLIPFELVEKATAISNNLKENEFTGYYFRDHLSEGIEILSQVPVVFELPKGMGEGKCLLDLVLINHTEKTIIPIDLKTTSNTAINFKSDYMKWKYYLQASYYSYGISSVTDYEIKNFKFIVASTTDLNRPMLWTCTKEDLNIGRFGGESPTGYQLKGWEKLCEEYNWHKKQQEWTYPKEVYDSNGDMELNAFKGW